MIIGAGRAGAKAAEILCEEGFDGRIVLLGAERVCLYERPPLSKEYLRGKAGLRPAPAYDRSRPRRLTLPGAELGGVCELRTLADSDALRGRLQDRARLTIVGGGWIGCAVAASARGMGLDVTLIEPHELPLQHALGPRLGAF